METIDVVEKGIKEELSQIGYEVYSFKYLPKVKTLEIVVDRDSDINLDDITEVSNKISAYLDEHDFTDSPYTLDVSSLGVEKPIKLEKLGENSLEGTLESCDENMVIISFKNKTRTIKAEINRKDIDRARLAIKF